MMEELHLEGKWWVPYRQDQKFDGTLTFDNQLKRRELTITSGSDFETSEMNNRQVKPKHDIILGQTSVGQKVTLKDCERGGGPRNVKDLGRYSFIPEYVLLGEHFERPEDIIFESVCITYGGKEINDWIKRVQFQACINSHDSAEVRIRDSYNIRVLLCKPKLLSGSERGGDQEQSRKGIPCIEIESLKEQKKSLKDYFNVNLIVFDFLNFIVTKEVHIESIQGTRETRKDSNEKTTSANLQENKPEVRIFYPYAIPNMFKPNQRTGAPLFPYEYERDSTEALLEKYLKKWFTLSDKARAFLALYFGVMYNTEMYRRFQFLGLAQALEAYHVACREPPTSRKWNNEIKDIKKRFSQIPPGCIDKIKDCHKPNYRDRVAQVYGEHSKIADKYFRTKDKKGKFSQKVAGTRNYYSHAAKGKRKGVVHEDKMLSLIQDLQLLLHLAIMKELGFTEEKFMQRYPVDKW
jgi:ApeA N-terminal domain 1